MNSIPKIFVLAVLISAMCASSAFAGSEGAVFLVAQKRLTLDAVGAYRPKEQAAKFTAEKPLRLPVVDEPPLPERRSSGMENFKRAFSNIFTVYYGGEQAGEFVRRHSAEHGMKDFSNYEANDAAKGAVKEAAGKEVDAKYVLYDNDKMEVREALRYKTRRPDFSSGVITFKTTVVGRTIDGLQRTELLDIAVKKPYGVHENGSVHDVDTVFRRDSSDIGTEARVRPFKWMRADFKGDVDQETYRVDNIREDLIFGRSNGDSFVLSYRHTKDFMREVSASAHYMVTDFAGVGYAHHYSFLDDKVTGRDYSVDFIHKCWGNSLVSTVRPDDEFEAHGCFGASITYSRSGHEERSVMVNFTITGVKRALAGN